MKCHWSKINGERALRWNAAGAKLERRICFSHPRHLVTLPPPWIEHGTFRLQGERINHFATEAHCWDMVPRLCFQPTSTMLRKCPRKNEQGPSIFLFWCTWYHSVADPKDIQDGQSNQRRFGGHAYSFRDGKASFKCRLEIEARSRGAGASTRWAGASTRS